jgi:hypothetical protein
MGGKCNRMGPWITPPLKIVRPAITTIYIADNGSQIVASAPPFMMSLTHP